MRFLPLSFLFACSTPSEDDLPAPQEPASMARCADDPHESNDSFDEAALWQDGPLIVTSRSDDYWTFEIYPGNYLEILGFFEHREGWGGLELYDEDGYFLDAHVLDPYASKLVWMNSGDYTQKVYLRATLYEGDCDAYSLTWMSWPVECPPDPIEDNDDLDHAKPVEPGHLDMVEIDDPDHWTLALPPHSVTGVYVDQPWSFADLSLDLYDAGGRFMNDGGVDGRIPHDRDQPGIGLASVLIDHTTQRGVCAPYILQARTATAFCEPEAVEDDVITDARTVELGRHAAQVELRDNDWHRVVVPPHQRLSVDLDVDPLLGRVWVYLHDETGRYFTADPAPPYALAIDNPTDDALVWHIRVAASEQLLSCVPYVMELGLHSCDRQDVLEPNNTVADALPLPESPTPLTVTFFDPDVWFVGSVPSGWVLDIDVAFQEGLGRVQSQLVDHHGNLLVDGIDASWGSERLWMQNVGPDPIDVFLVNRLFSSECAQEYEVAVDLWSYQP